jgi:integrase
MLLSELVLQLQPELSVLYRWRTINAYDSTLHSVCSFAQRDLELGVVFNQTWLLEYQAHLQSKGLKWNTISFYMRMLRSMYNRAIDAGWHVMVSRLFIRAFTGLAATPKRFIPQGLINKITRGKISPSLEFCRDMFILSFHLQGMAFADLALLKKTDIQGDVIMYRRQKSGSMVTVVIDPMARRILDKYAPMTEEIEYALPIVVDPDKTAKLQRESALRMQNRNLKKLAEELGIKENLTTHVARHSWATMAYRNNVPISTISEALGHKTEGVTRIYLASLGLEKLVQAIEIITGALDREEEQELEKERQQELEQEQEKEAQKETQKEAEPMEQAVEKETVRHLVGDGQESGANI